MRVGAVAGAMIASMAFAQPVVGGVTPTAAVVVAGSKCPGALRADQRVVGGERTAWTRALEDKDKNDQWPDPGGMAVHVLFENARRQTRSLELSVSYLPLEQRMMPVDPGANGKNAQEMKKNYALMVHDKTRVEGDLMVGPAAMVTRVHLISATFADGSVWHAPNEGACSVEPNRVIAVDGKESSLRW